MDNPPPILALVSDLMFAGRIIAEARAAAAPLKTIRQPAALGEEPGRMLIVDLNMPGAIPAAGAWAKASGRPVIGFVAHSDQATIAEAREAGIEQVVARSRFVQILPDLVRQNTA